MSDHIPDLTKMIIDTPRKDHLIKHAPIGLRPIPAFDQAVELVDALERELNAANDRIKRLRDGIAKQNLEIEQTCGKVLDYPWFKDDQKNFPGATEKDGVCVGEHVAETIAAELARKYTDAKQHIKLLEDAGEAMVETTTTPAADAWRKARGEAKP